MDTEELKELIRAKALVASKEEADKMRETFPNTKRHC